MATVTDILSAFGVTSDIATTVAMAELNPTSANVNSVITAYAKNGQTVPAALMSQLLSANASQYPNDPVTASWIPYLIGAGLVLWLIFKKRRA
jgi:hypothetical protein